MPVIRQRGVAAGFINTNGVRLMFGEKIEQTIRFSILEESDDCFHWPLARNKFSRPYTKMSGVKTTIARVLLIRKTGTNNPGMDAAHECGNKWCVNHKHIYWATRKQNEYDKLKHGTFYKKHSKLSKQNVEFIFLSDVPAASLAERYDVTKRTILLIRRGVYWNWFTSNLKKQ